MCSRAAINMARMLICLPANQTLPGKVNPNCKKSSAAKYSTCFSSYSSEVTFFEVSVLELSMLSYILTISFLCWDNDESSPYVEFPYGADL